MERHVYYGGDKACGGVLFGRPAGNRVFAALIFAALVFALLFPGAAFALVPTGAESKYTTNNTAQRLSHLSIHPNTAAFL